MSFDSAQSKTIDAVVFARHNISLVQQWAANTDYPGLKQDVMRRYAIQYGFIVISEAIKDIPLTLLKNYAPAELWRDVGDFRNFLAHTYDDLPDHRLISTIQEDLPELDSIYWSESSKTCR